MQACKYYLTVIISLLIAASSNAESLNLATGQATVTKDNQIILDNVSVGDQVFNATIQLNLDGSYRINQVEELFFAQSANYEVTFTSIWSEQTHPYEYPAGLSHFSGLIGATHDARINFWKLGELATNGIESMSETGSKSLLSEEINQQIELGSSHQLISGNGIGSSPGSVVVQLEVTKTHPFVSLVSMIAPSPDWFVGVSGLSLLKDGQWLQNLIVPLYVYDAGTDSGSAYTSANSDTQPKEIIERIEQLPFFANGELRSIGTFIFNRIE